MRFKTFYEGLGDLPSDPEADPKDKADDKSKDDKKPAKAEKPEKEEPKTLKDIFDDNKSAIKTFVPKKVYDAKRVEDSVKAPLFPLTPATPKGTYSTHDDDYIVRDHANVNKMWAVKNADFSKSFVPLNGVQKPDAEGYEKVRRSSKIDAFLYTGEDQKLRNGTTLTSNTYLIRADGSSNQPALINKDEFEADYEVQ
jgi:hypothetical protein